MANLLEDFDMPRSLRREMEHLFGEGLSTRSLQREMTHLLDEFDMPMTLRHRIDRLFDRLRGGQFVPSSSSSTTASTS